MRTPLPTTFLALIAALFFSLLGPTALAEPKAVPTGTGTMAAPGAAVWALGLLLTGALAAAATLGRAAGRHAAANKFLQAELARHAQEEGCRTAQQRELENGAESLAQTNALMAEAADRFQDLFQDLPVACVCCDHEGRIMEWNRAWTRLHGLENPLGQTVSAALGNLAGAAALTEAMQAARDGEAREGVAWTYHQQRDASPVHLLSSLFPLRGADGVVTGFLSADVDVSAQQEAEEALRTSEERLHTLYNTTSQQSLSFEEKTEAMLATGCAQFGLEIGLLAQSDGEQDGEEQYRMVQAHAPQEAVLLGATFRDCEAYCAKTLGGPNTPEPNSYISTPIRAGSAVWGRLCFAGTQLSPRLFTSGDRELVRLMAQWIGSEIARRQAEEAVQGSEVRFRTAIASMSEGLILMGADGIIHLWNNSAERILGKTQSEMRGWRPLNPEFAPVREDGSRFPEGSYPLMVSLRRGVPQPDVVMGLPRSGGGLVWVSVNAKPLFPAGGGPDAAPSAIVATFSDITERRHQEDLIAGQMVQIKEHSALLEAQKQQLEAVNAELETLALRDGLTGLSNRRAFGQRLALEMNRATRYGTPLSLLMLDVDYFKEYNDTFGHVAGDQVLRLLSQTLQIQGRETDFFARYGGEEFVVILPHTGSEGAETVAERLRTALSDTLWPLRPITASLGAATLLPRMTSEDDLISAADLALYAAKSAGRNRVIHALSLDSSAPSVPSTAV